MPDSPLLAFDLDGTLVQVGARIDYENAETFDSHCRPIKLAWARVVQAYADGYRILFLTGRREHLLDVTRRQVERWGGKCLANDAIISVLATPEFNWDVYIVHKAGALERHGAVLFVGDRDEDQTAAAMVDVAFLRAEYWLLGYAWEPVVESAPGSNLRIAAASTWERACESGVAADLFGIRPPVPGAAEPDEAGKVQRVQFDLSRPVQYALRTAEMTAVVAGVRRPEPAAPAGKDQVAAGREAA